MLVICWGHRALPVSADPLPQHCPASWPNLIFSLMEHVPADTNPDPVLNAGKGPPGHPITVPGPHMVPAWCTPGSTASWSMASLQSRWMAVGEAGEVLSRGLRGHRTTEEQSRRFPREEGSVQGTFPQRAWNLSEQQRTEAHTDRPPRTGSIPSWLQRLCISCPSPAR